MFKADGSEVRNPSAFVAKIGKYEGGLFTADGTKIRSPARFVEQLERKGQAAPPKRWRATGESQGPPQKGGGQGDAVVYKANGDPVRNPEAFIGKIATYEGGLFTADGQEIRNPKAFLAGLSRTGASAGAGGGRQGGEGSILYKADGTPIWNPRAFVDNIERYDGGLYTANGQEVWNPQAFMDGVERRGGASRQRQPSRPGATREVVVYKSTGELVWNPSRFVENIVDYSGGLYTADWQEIRNPKAFLAGLQRSSGAGAAVRGADGGKGAKGKQGDAPLYKADGTPIWNPEAYVANIYDYDGGLFTGDWQEVRNPQAFVAGLASRGKGSRRPGGVRRRAA